MRILAIISGEYGRRHVENIRTHAPGDWQIQTWQAPAIFPPIIDYPEDLLPAAFDPADLILSFAEQRGAAELLPDIARMTGATGVIASVDNESWLPRGLARQLRGWLERMDVVCVTPKPLCSLTEHDFGITRRQRMAYVSPVISTFARRFGQPIFDVSVDAVTRQITEVQVSRDAVCGCACYVAERLVGIPVDEAVEKTGLLHHHYPCLASMGIDPDFDDTLLHVSGNVFKDQVNAQVKPFLQINYLRPNSLSE